MNRLHHAGSTASALVTVRNEVSPDSLSTRLCTKLGMVVHDNTAMTLDETFVSPYWRDERGFAHAVPDFTHDANASLAHLPNDVQATRCWSEYTHEYVWLLMRRDGSCLVEGRAAGDAEALAKALLSYLERIEWGRRH